MVTSTADENAPAPVLPTAAMRDAMHAAELGDDVYGEDPSINELERLAAEPEQPLAAIGARHISGKVVSLRGLKEYVIVGRLIPAGTGLHHYHDFHMEEESFADMSAGEDEVYFQFDDDDLRTAVAAKTAEAQKQA